MKSSIKRGITQKLMIIFFLLSLFWCLLLSVSIAFILQKHNTSTDRILNDSQIMTATKEMQTHIANQNYALAAYLVTTGAGAVGDQKSLQLLQSSNDKLSLLVNEVTGKAGHSADRAILQKMTELNKSYKDKSDEVIAASQTSRTKADVIMQNEISSLSAQMMSKSNALAEIQLRISRESQISSEAQLRLLIWISSVLCLLAFCASVLIGYILAKRMSKPLIRMVESTELIAAGNLQIDHNQSYSHDEIGVLSLHFRQMVENLRELIGEIAGGSQKIGKSIDLWQHGAAEMNLSSHHIAAAMQEVQSSVYEQMTQVRLTNESTAEMTEGIRHISSNALRCAQQADTIFQSSLTGLQEMDLTVSQMNTLQESVQRSQISIQELNAHTVQIGKMTELISDIAKRTNILALNASIEATRAGADGRGFTVIANEVRLLSEQTARSAQEITHSIDQMVHNAKVITEASNRNSLETEQGMQAILRTKEAFLEIKQAIGDFTQDIQEVSHAALQMEGSTESIAKSIDSIFQMSDQTSSRTEEVSASTQQQLACVEEMLHSSNELSELAQNLNTLTRKFNW